MLKKLLKLLIVVSVLLTGLVVTLILLLNWKEEWLYEKFGKDRVLEFMKRFEPYITMVADEGTEGAAPEETHK